MFWMWPATQGQVWGLTCDIMWTFEVSDLRATQSSDLGLEMFHVCVNGRPERGEALTQCLLQRGPLCGWASWYRVCRETQAQGCLHPVTSLHPSSLLSHLRYRSFHNGNWYRRTNKCVSFDLSMASPQVSPGVLFTEASPSPLATVWQCQLWGAWNWLRASPPALDRTVATQMQTVSTTHLLKSCQDLRRALI